MTEKQLTIIRYIVFIIYVVVVLLIRWWSHTAFDVLMTLSIGGMIANDVRDDLRKISADR